MGKWVRLSFRNPLWSCYENSLLPRIIKLSAINNFCKNWNRGFHLCRFRGDVSIPRWYISWYHYTFSPSVLGILNLLVMIIVAMGIRVSCLPTRKLLSASSQTCPPPVAHELRRDVQHIIGLTHILLVILVLLPLLLIIIVNIIITVERNKRGEI